MSRNRSSFAWLGSVATLFSLAACYGTLAVIGIFGILGISIAFDETLWAGLIIAFAVLGQARGSRRFVRWSNWLDTNWIRWSRSVPIITGRYSSRPPSTLLHSKILIV